MAYKEQTGSGAARRGRRAHARVGARGGHGRKTQARRRRSGRQASQRATHDQRHSANAASGEHPTAGSVWSAASSVGSPGALLTLMTSGRRSPVGATLTLTGAQQVDTRATFDAWSAARDQAANRAWRRPGGLTRMAGL